MAIGRKKYIQRHQPDVQKCKPSRLPKGIPRCKCHYWESQQTPARNFLVLCKTGEVGTYKKPTLTNSHTWGFLSAGKYILPSYTYKEKPIVTIEPRTEKQTIQK